MPSTPTPDSSSSSPLRSARTRVPADAHALYERSLREGWGDGLPVLPATDDAVLALAAGTPLPLDHVVATLPPNRGDATVEKLAINAALCGVAPDAFGYVIAAIEAMTRPDHNLAGLTATTSGVVDAQIVNGPRRRDLGFDFGAGCLGGADGRGSSTVGRAVQLALRNIGGMRAGATSRTVFGQPARRSGLCFAEWEERSPWPSLAVQRGFRPEDEVVHVHAAKGTHAFADGNTHDDRALVQLIARSIATPLGNAFHGPPGRGETVVLVNPMWAERFGRTFADLADLQACLLEHARLPVGLWPAEARTRLEELGRVDPRGDVVVHERPGQFVVVVCGGMGNLHATVLPTWGESRICSATVRRG